MNIDWVDEDERRLVAAAERVVESRFEPISISDIDSNKAFDIANRAMLDEIMPSCGPIEYGLAEQVLPNLNWGSDTVATDAINEFIRRNRDGKIDPEAVRSHAAELSRPVRSSWRSRRRTSFFKRAGQDRAGGGNGILLRLYAST